MESTLPTGGCNYRDLSQPIANNCGCQRFWLRKKARKGRRRNRAPPRVNRISEERQLLIENETAGSTSATFRQDYQEEEDNDDEDVGNCYCGHHACFHSIDHPPSTAALAQNSSRRYSLQISDTETSIRLDRSGANLAASGISVASGTTTERDACSSEQSASMVTARRIKSHYQPSQLGSEHGSKSSTQNTNTPIMDPTPMILDPKNQLEATTTSVKTLQSMTASTTTVIPPSETEIRQGLADLKRDVTACLAFHRANGDQLKLQNERLETVETFGSVLEELKDRIELMEDRNIECENKVLSFEDRLGDRLAPVEAFLESRSEKRKHSRQGDGSVRRKRRRHEPEALGDSSSQQEVKATTIGSFTSTISTSNSFSGTSSLNTGGSKESTNARVLGVLEGYESRFLELEDVAPPTISRPWVVEVVLLPPAPLKGVWIDPYAQPDSGTQYESSNPQSTNTTNTTSGLTYSRRALGEPETPGMVPKSFGITRRIYRRLYSRGFVRTLAITAGTARDVAVQIEANFSELLDWCRSFEADSQASSFSQQASTTTTPTKPLMCSSAWQPLRKVHKQTLLEFLRPGEMMDGIWTVEFLRGTCMMKGQRNVLYITPLSSNSSSTMSWSDIKSLPKFAHTPVEGEPPLDVPKPEESDDECWSYRPILDDPVISFTTAINSPGSSFGPFQLEEEVPDPPGVPSPPLPVPFPFRRRNRKSSMTSSSTSGRRKIGRKFFGGSAASPANNTGNVTPVSCIAGAGRSGSYPPDRCAGVGGLIRRASSGSKGEGGAREDEWELSPATLGWFTQHPLDESCDSSDGDSQHTTLGGDEVEEEEDTEEGGADDGDAEDDVDCGYESADRESNDS
ncbi:hypothetical protein L873DRAFT_1833759 [Choiromyces venosus 120613-1]|uniref:Uncharacterized protein n=1 Tax=Choiromyces venosus 120613-1 TaxID=1336337 RepID=A0A3N4K4B2_9PEZI|nr:hypothetical protein L873DRAFT_1833759 [Choiromyces venosus 120613-1]